MLRKIIFKAAALMLLAVVIGTKFSIVVVATPDIIVVPSPGYETIQKAINAANPGNIIKVTNGTYYENLLVNKSVSIIGENPATTIIDGGLKGHVINIIASNVMISGFTIQNGKQGNWEYCGISIFRCNFTVINNTISRDNYFGLQLIQSYNNTIFNSLITNNSCAGVKIRDNSNNNAFFENTIRNNSIGLWVTDSTSNVLFHNNFVNNTSQSYIFSPTILDNGAEGNYWSDYIGSDTDLDGIGNSPFAGDHYPLMGMFTNFTVQYGPQTYFLSVICNSSVSNFEFDKVNGKVSFGILGPNGTIGFCRIAAPTTLIQSKYIVSVGDGAPAYIRNWTVSTYIYGYFLYLHTVAPQKVTVTLDLPKNEAPPLLVYTLVATILIAIALTIIILMKRKNKVK
jgi:parallel beta-helix repeat protein